jgi:hypothetical protein
VPEIQNFVPGQARSRSVRITDGNTKNEIRLNVTSANIPPSTSEIPEHFQGSINSVNF